MCLVPDHDHTAWLPVTHSLSTLYLPVRSSYVAEEATLRMFHWEKFSTLAYDPGDSRSDGTP
jgi:hypothetical protein